MKREEAERMLKDGVDCLTVSIVKWYDVVEKRGDWESWDTCGCCLKYRADGCVNCPIAQDSGHPYCAGTYYEELSDHVEECGVCSLDENDDYPSGGLCSEAMALAEKQRDYLMDLAHRLGTVPEYVEIDTLVMAVRK